jgi:lysophospholipase L1-like esterase
MNGELPESIHPRVFWVLIGTNDLGNTWCSPDATLLGILRVVEEIKRKRPGSLIVINSVLPRSWHQKGKVWEGKQKTKESFLPQLWTSINDINRYLKLYCENQEHVIFFDANDIFFSNHFENPWQQDLTLDKNLMYDYLHPSYEGYKIWGDKIVQELDRLLG